VRVFHAPHRSERPLTLSAFTEWIYILSGKGRATAFPGGQAARTFDFEAGDTGVFPSSYGHYMASV
jgi:oxalate decarboxylase/phosphoglucose isomerase-like protein (cupin superfamily)